VGTEGCLREEVECSRDMEGGVCGRELPDTDLEVWLDPSCYLGHVQCAQGAEVQHVGMRVRGPNDLATGRIRGGNALECWRIALPKWRGRPGMSMSGGSRCRARHYTYSDRSVRSNDQAISISIRLTMTGVGKHKESRVGYGPTWTISY
jgi:hypothetical protein